MENKNIDPFFQEKLKDITVTPNPTVWKAIRSKLKKKKSRISPIIWGYSGVAAILILGFFLFPFSTQKKLNVLPENHEQITTAPKEKNNSLNNKKEKLINRTIEDAFIASKKETKKATVSIKNTQQLFANNAIQNQGLKDPTKKALGDDEISSEKKGVNDKITVEKKSKKESYSKKVVTKKNLVDQVSDDKKITKQHTKNRWEVTPVFAVLTSNSFSNTSPIDKDLSNSTQGNTSYSFGVQVAYQLNKQWSVRSGIHLQELIYSNHQVAIVSSSTENASNTTFDNGDAFSFISRSNSLLNTNDFTSFSLEDTNGEILQKYGYLEIPLEVEYSVLNTKKFSVHMIAGFSSLFLNKNEIQINSNTLSISGEANNLNTINFSGNIGLDFEYAFRKNWTLNINPMFKTQFQTFSENANGFKPYFIGVYTGVKYQF